MPLFVTLWPVELLPDCRQCSVREMPLFVWLVEHRFAVSWYFLHPLSVGASFILFLFYFWMNILKCNKRNRGAEGPRACAGVALVPLWAILERYLFEKVILGGESWNKCAGVFFWGGGTPSPIFWSQITLQLRHKYKPHKSYWAPYKLW